MKKNDKFIGKCSAYNSQGMGIVKYNDIVFFVPGIIKGETAEILIVKMLKNYGYGKLIKLIETSNHRKEPKCSVYKYCGGCHLQHMDKDEQAFFKTQLVKDCFRNIANMDITINDVLDMNYPYRYRNKVQVPFAKDKDGNLKVQNQYEMVTEFNEYGFAGIKVDGKWGVINEEGTIVQEPIYVLESVSPTFIGTFYKANEWYGNSYFTDKVE